MTRLLALLLSAALVGLAAYWATRCAYWGIMAGSPVCLKHNWEVWK